MTYANPTRHVAIKAIHAMSRELALTDDCYRAILSRLTSGRASSAADLTAAERREVMDELRRLGAGRKTSGKAKAAPRRRAEPAAEPRPVRPAASKSQEMIRGLWLEMAGMGIVDAGESALAAFIKRQAGVDALQFLAADKVQSVMGALKPWKARVEKQRAAAGKA